MMARPVFLPLAALLVLSLVACARSSTGASSGASAPSGGGPAAKPALASDFFAGKTVTLLVNFSAGGPSDVFARLLAQHLDRHMPGRPTLIVENRPGAGGVVGMNHLYNVVRKDGLTIGVFTPYFVGQALGAEGVQFDESRFLYLGATTETQISFISPTAGVRTLGELARTSNEIVAGALSPESSKDLAIRTLLNALGVRYKYVTGYPGNADVRAAFQRGEVNFAEESLSGWTTGVVPLVNAGTALPLGQRGILKGGQIVRDPRVADIPIYNESIVEARGEEARRNVDYRALAAIIGLSAMSREIVYPPGTDMAIVEAMRQAMAATVADPEFLAAAEKLFGFQIEFLSGAEAQTLSERIVRESQQDVEALEHLKRLSKQGG